ncbi:MAG: glycosyltransferase, partial [Actinobacteria bacterium]|nr:glycosyltransferase [Actinomycetota bacterium]
MKVLLPTIRDPGQIGGTTTHVSMLARGLEETGNQVEALYLGGAIPESLGKTGVVWPAGMLNRIRSGWGMMYAAETRGRLLASVTGRELARALHRGAPWEVLNAQEVYSVPYLRRVADDFGVPLVLTLHGYPLFESVSEGYSASSEMGRRFLMRAEMRALRLADAVVTVDTRLFRHVLTLVPERSTVTYSLMNFIDTSAFAPPADRAEAGRLRSKLRKDWDVPEDRIVLFCPRRLVKKNGVIYPSLALAAMAPGDRERFLLLHAGEGGERDEIERIIRENSLDKNVRLLGGQGRDA